MKILISGGSSTLARSLQPVLSSFADVITAGRTNCDVRLDLNDPVEAMVLPTDVDVIVHTAAHFGGNTGQLVIEAENINTLGSLKLCEAGVRVGIKHFVFISTAFATLTDEDSSYNIYTASKKHAEEALTVLCRCLSIPLSILRPSQIYGNGEQFRRHQPFFYAMIDKAQNGQDIVFYGSHDPVRNYIHIYDVVRLVKAVILQQIEGIFSCTSQQHVTYSEIAQTAFKVFASGGKVVFRPEKPAIPDKIVQTDDTLYQKSGIFPAISIEDGIKMIANYRSSGR